MKIHLNTSDTQPMRLVGGKGDSEPCEHCRRPLVTSAAIGLHEKA